jgi:acyl-CoA thioester hydrolase
MSASEPSFVDTYRGIAHSWLCDGMGHLNSRHYLAMFDDALQHFMLMCGLHPAPGASVGLADVNVTMRLKWEVTPGALVRIESAVRAIGNSSVTTLHRMIDAASDTLHAECEIVSVRFDLENRLPVPLSSSLRARIGQRLVSA